MLVVLTTVILLTRDGQPARFAKLGFESKLLAVLVLAAVLAALLTAVRYEIRSAFTSDDALRGGSASVRRIVAIGARRGAAGVGAFRRRSLLNLAILAMPAAAAVLVERVVNPSPVAASAIGFVLLSVLFVNEYGDALAAVPRGVPDPGRALEEVSRRR